MNCSVRMSVNMAFVIAMTLASISAVSLSEATLAQDIGEHGPSPIMCLQGREGLGDNLGRAFYIEVPDKFIPTMLERGFELTSCKSIDHTADPEFCSLAKLNNSDVNTYIWMRFSFTTKERCDFIHDAIPLP